MNLRITSKLEVLALKGVQDKTQKLIGKEVLTKCCHYEGTVAAKLKLIPKKKSYKTDMVPSHTEQLGPLEMRFCSNPKCQNILLWTKGREMTDTRK